MPGELSSHLAPGKATPHLGVVLTNLGSPDAPTASGLRAFYAEFLSDRRVIEVPRIIWNCILWLFILPFRPFVVAKLYRSIWWPEGSPLTVLSERLREKVDTKLAERFGKDTIKVVSGMRYGNPSISKVMTELKDAHVSRLLVLPLYPQAAAATTATSFDAVSSVLQKWRYVPALRTIMGYHDDPGYIRVLADSIRNFWDSRPEGRPEVLLFSFHGVPRKTLDAGDPYHCFCLKTARLTAEALGLPFHGNTDWCKTAAKTDGNTKFVVTFQSRFLFSEWVKPYSDDTVQELGRAGIKSMDIIAPAFSVDCLETLEEVQVQLKETFVHAGGEQFRYIPCLNDSDAAADVYVDLIARNMLGWPEATPKEHDHHLAHRAVSRAKLVGWDPRKADVDHASKVK